MRNFRFAIYNFIDTFPDVATLSILTFTSILELLIVKWTILLKAIAFMFITFVVTLPVNLFLKNIFKIKRPSRYRGSGVFKYSFPSFHAQFSASEATTYVVVVMFLSKNAIATMLAALIMIPSSALIAYSRVGLNVHSAKDAVAGFIVGVLIGFAVGTVSYSLKTPKYIDCLFALSFLLLLYIVSKKERSAKFIKA